MDCIQLRDLRFLANHGVLKEEKTLGQRFDIDIDLYLNLTQAGLTDVLTETINYAEIYELIENEVTGKCYDLIEKLCYRLVCLVLSYDVRIQEAQVTVKKPQAPIKGHFDCAAVIIKRSRHVLDLSEFGV